MNVGYLDYKKLKEFYTIPELCELFEMTKSELRSKCEQYHIIVPIVTIPWIKTRASMTITTNRRPSSTGKAPGSSVLSWKLTVRVSVRLTPLRF